MAHVTIDGGTCQGHGRCALIAPEYFDVDDAGTGLVRRNPVADEDLPDLRQAISSCPESAIHLVR